MLLLVTGLPSPGKTQLVDALSRRFGSTQVIAGALPGAHAGTVLHVHAETDLEAFVEGEWPQKHAAREAALVLRVDWEPTHVSVDRVMQTLHARALAPGA